MCNRADRNIIIDALAADHIDWKGIAINVAKQNPAAFVRALVPSVDDRIKEEYFKKRDWHDETQSYVGGKIPAIKVCRDLLGLSLRDAKHYVEKLCDC